ncbi:MAG: 4-alpha-glucanotransferase [Nitrospirota bacterium]
MSPIEFPLPFLPRKTAGVMVPLSALRSERNGGIGDFGDLPAFMVWMKQCGFGVVQLLPMNEMGPGETCPYQALSGLASDPIYLALDQWEDAAESPTAQGLLSDEHATRDLAAWRREDRVQFRAVREFKDRVLRAAFADFLTKHGGPYSDRGQAFRDFREANSKWLTPFARFRVLKTLHQHRDWSEWPDRQKQAASDALARVDVEHFKDLLYIQYQQWALWEQWQAVRREAERLGIKIAGDLPFLVSRDSADVWSRQGDFDLTHSIGAPVEPAYPEQDWGLPLFRWSVVEAAKFPWWRQRMRIVREWFDLVRIDHVVGLFRVWMMAKGETSRFEPTEEPEQIRRGEVFLTMIAEERGKSVPIAEDLGLIPPFVRATLGRMGIAGHKVLRWERDDGVYRDPSDYPFASMATTGTHDTTTLSVWWKTAEDWEREAFLELFDPDEAERAGAMQPHAFTDDWHQMILDRIFSSGSGLVLLPFQDVFGHDDQINVPATVGPHNWTYRIPCTIEDLSRPPYEEKGKMVRSLLEKHGRVS